MKLKHVKSILAAFALVLTVGILAACGKGQKQFEQGEKAFKAKDYETAITQFKLAAEQGNADAMNRLAECYLNGYGVEKDAMEAGKWYTEAKNNGPKNTDVNIHVIEYYEKANQGLAEGFSSFGDLYAGEAVGSSSVKEDIWEAVKWYKKAAEQGDIHAMLTLGLLYERGDNGVRKDLKEAEKWFRMAVEKGNAHAMFLLGTLYVGFTENKDEGRALVRQAAEKGDEKAKELLEGWNR